MVLSGTTTGFLEPYPVPALSLALGGGTSLLTATTSANIFLFAAAQPGGGGAAGDIYMGNTLKLGYNATDGLITVADVGDALTIGNPAQTGAIKIGESTAALTMSIFTGSPSEGAKTLTIGGTPTGTGTETINIGAGGNVANFARTVNIGNGSINTRVVVFDRVTTGPGAEFNVNGQIGIGSADNTKAGGRIWIRSNGMNYRFNSVSNLADYSEYIAQSEPSAPGDVMVVDPNQAQRVRRSQSSYEENILGVISTTGTGYNNDPDVEDRANNPNWANVGMLGQVDVKVTTENGAVSPGDRLTSSSQPGVAMKATRPGQVVGRALDYWSDPDPSHIGMLKILVSPSYFDPSQEDDNQADLESLRFEAANMTPYTAQIPFAKGGEAQAASNFGKYSIQGIVSGTIKTLGKFTTAVIANLKAGILESEEVTTNTLTANRGAFGELTAETAVIEGLSISTLTPNAGAVSVALGTEGQLIILGPNGLRSVVIDGRGNAIFAGEIVAKTIRAERIEGLEIYTDKLDSLSSLTNVLAAEVSANLDPLAESGLTLTRDFTATGTASFSGPVNFQALVTFIQNLIIKGRATFEQTTEFLSDVFFRGNVKFLGGTTFLNGVTFNNDTGGVAVIPKSTASVEVKFAKPYQNAPIVTITLVLKEATDSAFLAEAAKAAVAEVTASGFTIVLDQPVPRDLEYNWFALSVEDVRRTVGKSLDDQFLGSETTPTPTPVPTLSPTPMPEPTLPASGQAATLIPTLMPSPTSLPTVTPVMTPTPTSLPPEPTSSSP